MNREHLERALDASLARQLAGIPARRLAAAELSREELNRRNTAERRKRLLREYLHLQRERRGTTI